MRSRGVLSIPVQAVLFVLLAVFFSYADLYLFYTGATSLPAAYIFLGVLLLVGVAVLLKCLLSRAAMSNARALLSAQMPVLAPLVLLSVVSLLASFLPQANWEEGTKYTLLPFYDGSVVVLCLLLPFLRSLRTRMRVYFAGAFVLFAASVMTDVVLPGTMSRVATRAAGFAVNPNTAAFLLVVLCCCIVRYDRPRLVDMGVLALTTVGVFATLSRGGLLLVACLVGGYIYEAANLRRLNARTSFVFALAILLASWGASEGIQAVRGSALFARTQLSASNRAEMASGERAIASTDDARYRVAAESLGLIAGSPLVGYGSGYTALMPIGPHNIYLKQWIDSGLAGLLAYLWLLVSCTRLFWRRQYAPGKVFMALVFVQGFFSHNLLDERAFLASLGVLLALSYYHHQDQRRAGAQPGERRPPARAHRGMRGARPRWSPAPPPAMRGRGLP